MSAYLQQCQQIVGYSLNERMTSQLVCNALSMVLAIMSQLKA